MPKSEQGVEKSQRYQIIPRTLIFITCKEDVLLLKGAPDKKLWANRYNGIGGHVERGEDILSAAQRELAEEAGLRDVHLWMAGTIVVDVNENVGVGVYVFRGEVEKGLEKSSHEGQLEWVGISAISNMPLVEDLFVILPKLLQLKEGDGLLSIRSWYDDDGKMKVSIRS